MNVKYEWSRIKEKFWLKLAWLVPKNLAYWCAIRVGANASGAKYPTQIVPDLTFMDTLKRWEENPG